MNGQTRETVLNAVCFAMCLMIGVFTSMGFLGVDPNTLGNTKQICKDYEHAGTSCKMR